MKNSTINLIQENSGSSLKIIDEHNIAMNGEKTILRYISMNDLKQEIISSGSKVLATYGSCGLNVVPVSAVEFTDDSKIIFFNFFMDKTVSNIIPSKYGNRGTNHAAFTYWSGNNGKQLKGNVEYINEGDFFESQRENIASNYKHLSQLNLKGVIVFEIQEIFDISKPTAK